MLGQWASLHYGWAWSCPSQSVVGSAVCSWPLRCALSTRSPRQTLGTTRVRAPGKGEYTADRSRVCGSSLATLRFSDLTKSNRRGAVAHGVFSRMVEHHMCVFVRCNLYDEEPMSAIAAFASFERQSCACCFDVFLFNLVA